MLAAATVVMAAAPAAHADNRRLNQSVISNIFTAQRRNDCPTHLSLDERLVEAAHRHTLDLLASIELDGDLGSDGSTPQMRAEQAGFNAKASETVAITPALAISGMEILNQWWNDPVARQTMQNCSNSAVGVWSENSVARTVVVAVYGQPGS
ncbi:CAP domain-containing protein [Mycobacterium eburneum]|nr:CAP domain-containing protein [Mycobacterium eburneum]